MKKRLVALSVYALFWLAFFVIARLFFILMQSGQAFTNPISELFATFSHGIRLDISATGYFMIFPFLVLLPGLIFRNKWQGHVIRWYTYFLIVFSSVIVVADANLYTYWGFRIDFTPMLYLKTPKEAMASVSGLKILAFVITIVLMSSFFIFCYKKLIDRFFRDLKLLRFPLPELLVYLVLCAALILPIRGGVGVAPINAGAVYFSSKMFLNHAAINAVWNMGYSGFGQRPHTNPYEFGDQAAAKVVVDSLMKDTGSSDKVLNNRKPNIIIIVLESFSGYLIGPLGGDSLVTPNINRYSKEGILFTNFYASGTRTDKAMPAILDGYPAQPAQSIIKEPNKTQGLPSMVRMLIEDGYNSAFWYGGEINFANFNSFVVGSGFRSIITQNNFNPADFNAKWGVHDHVMFRTLEDSMRAVREPFLKVVLTLSSHEPFDVPMKPVFEGSDMMTRYKNSVYYADMALGSFLDWAKQTDWWKNTLIVMVADHCARLNDMPNYSPDVFKIPMLWVGGAVEKKGLKVSKLGGQTDIPKTILSQLGLAGNFPFGKDLLSAQTRSFAFYTYNEGFGFVTDSSAVGFDLKSRTPMLQEGKNPEAGEKMGKAFLQVLFDDYIHR